MKVELSVEDAIIISGIYGSYLKLITDSGIVTKDEIKEVEEAFTPIMAKIYDSFSEEDDAELERIKTSLK